MTYLEYLTWLEKRGVKVARTQRTHSRKLHFQGKTLPIPFFPRETISLGVKNFVQKKLGI